MTKIETKHHLLHGDARKKVKLDTLEIIQENHIPTRRSRVPQQGDQERRRLTKNIKNSLWFILGSERLG